MTERSSVSWNINVERTETMENLAAIIKTLEDGPKSFSDIKDSTQLENGVLQYHINNSGDIVREKKAVMLKDQCKRCDLKRFCQERCIASFVDEKDKKQIIKYLESGLGQREIARQMQKSPSTINYHVNQLKRFNIVESDQVREEVLEHLEL